MTATTEPLLTIAGETVDWAVYVPGRQRRVGSVALRDGRYVPTAMGRDGMRRLPPQQTLEAAADAVAAATHH